MRKRYPRIEREYPTNNGFPVSPFELELPPSEFNTKDERNLTNHHSLWTRRRMGLLGMTQMLRDLEAYQDNLPRDVHSRLHSAYAPPTRLPTLPDIMQRLDDAYEGQERLRYGSAMNPKFERIDPYEFKQVKIEYELHR